MVEQVTEWNLKGWNLILIGEEGVYVSPTLSASSSPVSCLILS